MVGMTTGLLNYSSVTLFITLFIKLRVLYYDNKYGKKSIPQNPSLSNV